LKFYRRIESEGFLEFSADIGTGEFSKLLRNNGESSIFDYSLKITKEAISYVAQS
jgi:hypothetical protein